MDIRNFFSKKSGKKKPSPPASSKAAKAESSSTLNKSTDKRSRRSKEPSSEPAKAFSKRKREPTVEDNDDDSDATDFEISPQEFFANSSKEITKKQRQKNRDTEDSAISNPVAAKKNRTSPRRKTTEAAKAEPTTSTPRKKPKRRMVLEESDGDDDNDEDFVNNENGNDEDLDDDFVMETQSSRSKSSRAKPSPRTPQSSTKRNRSSPAVSDNARTPTSASKKRKAPAASATKPSHPPLLEPGPELERDGFDVDGIKASECLAGLAFVFTGNMTELNRDDALELVKTLGGRVTTAVSGKTNYLVVGPVLEDGRDYTEGSKYKKAKSYGDGNKIKLVMGEKQLYGLCHYYHDKAMKERGIDPTVKTERATASPPATTVPSNPHAKKAPAGGAVSNPYAKSTVSNPYARKGPANPYAKKDPSSNPYSKPVPSAAPPADATATATEGASSLWVDKHKPVHSREILGNKTNVKKLQDWLRTWERTFNNAKASNKTFTNPRGPWKAALLSGPPGIGKTTTATLVAKEDGRDVLEYNASDARSKKALQVMGDLTGSQGLNFGNANNRKPSKSKKPEIQKRCIIMDEVDGMGAGDRSGMSELIQMIKKSKTPIICICNDRQSQKLKSLLPYCMDLKYSRPTKNSLANRAIRIAEAEGLSVERNAAEAIAESCGNDVRQVLNLLQMWSQKKDAEEDTLTYKQLKDRGRSIQKDEMLRVSLFDAAKLIVEGPRNLQDADPKARLGSLMKRNDAFFVDYSFTGMIVQQNYPKVTNSQFQRIKGDEVAELEVLERFHKASMSMSDYDLADSQIRGGDLNWSLLPTTAMLTVKTGFHAGGDNGGFLGGYPEFTAWMGKRSSMAKNYRLLNEVHHHMNYRISANAQELRRTYLPVLREKIFRCIQKANPESNKDAIGLMDDYGLSRDDVVEKLDVLVLGKKGFSFEDLDSKQKTAFTKQYNAGVHTSQALVREQGGGGTASRKKKRVAVFDEDEDDGVDRKSDSEEEIDEEKELARLQAQFKKKGRRKAAPKKKTAGKK